MLNELLKDKYNLTEDVIEYTNRAEEEIKDKFTDIDKITDYNQLKVIAAFQNNRISEMHFNTATGYGYDDLGRDTIEKVYAEVFKTEDALVRPQIISGTHALTVALSGNLRPGDEILSPAGAPYDTLQKVIGIKESKGSLKEYGITYSQVDLKPDGSFDFDKIESSINDRTKLIAIQRSKGYEFRDSFTIEKIEELIKFIKGIREDLIIMVDNCYGEFVDYKEPSEIGADLVVGSLIKNPGGGLAPVGGYIAGKSEYVENASYRLTVPGQGKEVGPSLGVIKSFYQGLFSAPQVVNSSVKGALLASKMFENLGYETNPKSTDKRSDIVQAIRFKNAEKVIAFCQGIQKGAAIDSHVQPQPWDMPGYDSEVIMAAGAFVQGSSIELSADAPIKEPYDVYLQGGLNYSHAKLGIMIALQEMINRNLITIKK
ncbi:MAG: methionine gamma-lyase family protein [Clostridia bacterium]|jgi:cystathionine beta-lyase family protein involved in aluminum resistance|nr:methionine gamma-lyase family protein [Clostridia bacterium]